MIEINQLDLFSGIGGFHLGFERAGFKVNSFFSEVDKHAIAVYKQQFKDSKYVGSVTNVRGADLPRIDLITFGSPCQDFSTAGKREGMEGERSSLIVEAIRIIHECRPRVFVWENVKGTFSSNDGRDFAAIIKEFANIGGYRLEWQLLNTSWFLPQNRERIYLVGYSTTPGGDWRGIFPIERPRKADHQSSKKQDSQTLMHTICTNYWRFANDTPVLDVSTDYNYKKVNKTIEQNAGEFKRGQVKMMDLHNRRVQDISPCLVEPHHNAHALFDSRPIIYDDYNGKFRDDGNTGSLTCNSGSKSPRNGLKVVQDYRIRRLTPIECERLQGFPDNHTAFGNYDGEVKPVSNTQRYKQCGNAVTVDVVKAVAEKIKPLFK